MIKALTRVATVLLWADILSPSGVLAQRGTAPLSTADVAARATPAIASVVALGADHDTIGQGTAFVIRADGILVTNYHVLAGASSAVVTLASRESFSRVRVLDADSVLDLAILKIPTVGLTSLQTRTGTPRVGDKVIAIGNPLGLTNSVSEGIVSASRIVRGHELVQITAPISPGSSGGAVLDAVGNVFAVSTSYLEGGQALNFAVPIRYAVGLLNDHGPERAVNEVFASAAVSRGSSTSDAASAGELPTGLRRAKSPRTDVSGTYELTDLRRDAAGNTVLEQWGLLMATKEVGFLVLASKLDSNKFGPTQVYGVSRWATNASGDVVLTVGGVSYDGYQTDDDGFVAETSFTLDNGQTRTSRLGAVPTRLPLSRNDGLFTARVRTWYKVRNTAVGEAVDWAGDLAVAFADGTMYVDLVLRNSSGGSTSLYSSGRLNGDAFDLHDDHGHRLTGTIQGGVLRADWIDQREGNASFSGSLVAERR